MRVLTVVGARPQFVKAAVVSRALRDFGIEEKLVHTGQHYDARLSDIFFAELGLSPPDRHLGIGGLSHGAMTGRMLEALEGVLVEEEPDLVLVYGDTNSTLAGALAASKLHIPVAHVEAGMRSFDRRMPEELNRVLTDHLATILFCTSETPVRLLANEGIVRGVHITGDPMYDAVRLFSAAARSRPLPLATEIGERPYAVATLHRAENTDDPARLAGILDGLATVAREIAIVLPLHPRTAKKLGRSSRDDRILITEPVGYLDLQRLLAGASLVLTDSGGLQKEAFWHEVPCVTLRDTTEWTETIESGWNVLAGADPQAIVARVRAALSSPPAGPAPKVYGDARAGKRIAELIAKSE